MTESSLYNAGKILWCNKLDHFVSFNISEIKCLSLSKAFLKSTSIL